MPARCGPSWSGRSRKACRTRSRPAAAEIAKAAALSDAEVERLVAEHSQARKARNFARSDEIRNQLAEKGIMLENTKDGVRWKRK